MLVWNQAEMNTCFCEILMSVKLLFPRLLIAQITLFQCREVFMYLFFNGATRQDTAFHKELPCLQSENWGW